MEIAEVPEARNVNELPNSHVGKKAQPEARGLQAYRYNRMCPLLYGCSLHLNGEWPVHLAASKRPHWEGCRTKNGLQPKL